MPCLSPIKYCLWHNTWLEGFFIWLIYVVNVIPSGWANLIFLGQACPNWSWRRVGTPWLLEEVQHKGWVLHRLGHYSAAEARKPFACYGVIKTSSFLQNWHTSLSPLSGLVPGVISMGGNSGSAEGTRGKDSETARTAGRWSFLLHYVI